MAVEIDQVLIRVMNGVGPVAGVDTSLISCQRIENGSSTTLSGATVDIGIDIYTIVYNGLASQRSIIVRLPVSRNATYSVTRLDSPGEVPQRVQSTLSTPVVTTGNIENAAHILLFNSGPLPPVGAAIIKISLDANHNSIDKVGAQPASQLSRNLNSVEEDTVEVTNGLVTVAFERCVV